MLHLSCGEAEEIVDTPHQRYLEPERYEEQM
jgi:hypothetical protein